MKAIKILTEYYEACVSLAEESNKKGRFELAEGNLKEATMYKKWTDERLDSAQRIEDAIDEIKKLQKLAQYENLEVIETKDV